MTATPKGAVEITTSWSDPEVVECLLQQDGEVIGTLLVMLGGCQGKSPPGFITCFARLLNFSGEKDSKNCWYLDLSHISILSTAAVSTRSLSRPACSFRLKGIRRRPAESSSTMVAPFRKYLLNCRTSGSKSFNWLILAKIGSQLFIG